MTIDAITIRPVASTDRDLWMPLWCAYQAFYEVDIPADVSEATWNRFADPAEPMRAALAWRGGAAVGMVHWIFHRSTWTIGDYCYLQDLFVSPDVRGGGVGRTLIEHVYAEAGRAGAARVYWLTHETNGPAMALYDRVADKSGFVQYRKGL